ncbi:hypothetical protein KIN20_029784 [Parelaphostrongylus tenuis]|uniref:Uncharacterized protein n=1 Tax=Parelaphostrongylus tenuis TaxID=148309 RepID=A0AAD5WFY8_PARTN|nr:hypothetical protein KIN20_029784 [Parelaphostrongylus tenuis]
MPSTDNLPGRHPPGIVKHESRTDPTLEQKQYAQGFLDALRAVQQIHNFEFEKKVLSPGFIAPIVGTAEFLYTHSRLPFQHHRPPPI